MIPSSLTAARGFVLRKVAGRFDACRSLASSCGMRVTHPSLLGTVGVFMLMLLPLLAILAVTLAALHLSPLAGVGAAKAMSMLTGKKLREQRATLGEQANAILKDAGEAKSLSAEKQAEFEKIHADVEIISRQIELVERQEAFNAKQAESQGVIAGKADDAKPDARTDGEKAYTEAFNAYIRGGMAELSSEQRAVLRGRRVEAGKDAPVHETRAAQTVTTTGGGYLIPQGFSDALEVSLKAYGNVEAAADVFETDTGNTLPWPTIDDTSNTGRLLAINTAVTETAVTYGVINFAAYKFSADMVTVPNELMQDSAFDVNNHIGGVLGVRIGRVHNTYQTTGTGSSQPQGIVVGSSSGVTAAAVSTVTYDELLALEHSVDPAYRNPAFGAGWMFNDGTLLKLKQIKDGEGRPMWQPSLQAGAPGTIDGFPYFINQDMAAMTTGLKPVLFGALKKFKIRKVRALAVRRLDERYADLDQVAFIAFTRMDSHVLDSGTDPMKYITMA